MKLVVIAAAAGALMLSACNKSETPAADASAAATPDAAAPAAAAADAAPAAAGGVATKDFVVGSWGDNGDCELAIEFKADGSMVGPFDKWSIDDQGVLTMEGNPQKMHLKVVDQDNMEGRLDGTGEPRRINRCK